MENGWPRLIRTRLSTSALQDGPTCAVHMPTPTPSGSRILQADTDPIPVGRCRIVAPGDENAGEKSEMPARLRKRRVEK